DGAFRTQRYELFSRRIRTLVFSMRSSLIRSHRHRRKKQRQDSTTNYCKPPKRTSTIEHLTESI
ncbi:hypothetical protein CP061683_0540B, partial [Chlamydia psittaci 06-1683]